MKPVFDQFGARLFHGDCIEVMRVLPDESVHAVVTDPPYGLGFMGKAWDDLPPGEDWARECLRVLKPGGHLLAFGGTRTWHRLAVAVEDAGFEIRDSIAWLHGQGFPKSMDVSKAIDRHLGAERTVTREAKREFASGESVSFDARVSVERERRDDPATDAARTWKGWGTTLKPAFEPIVVGRKPMAGTVAANVLVHGTGAMNIDGTRIPGQWTTWQVQQGSPLAPNGPAYDSVGWGNGFVGEQHPGGRHPANVLLDESQAESLDAESGILKSGEIKSHLNRHVNVSSYKTGFTRVTSEFEANEGGASRFFPVFRYEAKAPSSERPKVNGIAHPTVKPVDLMRWLVRLVTPPGGTVLEPFAGSGTTLEAALAEGFDVIGIEREADYLPLIEQRLARPITPALDLGEIA